MNLRSIPLKKKLLYSVALPLAFLVTIAVLSIWIIGRMKSANHWVDHTHKVMGEANLILGSAIDMETGMRGYLLAGKEEFLEPYNGGAETFEVKLKALKQTLSDNPEQITLLNEINANVSAWRSDVVEPTIELRRKIGDADTMDDMADLVGEARGKTYFDKFRGQIALFIDREQKLMVTRKERAMVSLKAKDATKFDELTDAFKLGGSHPQGHRRGAVNSSCRRRYGNRHARISAGG